MKKLLGLVVGLALLVGACGPRHNIAKPAVAAAPVTSVVPSPSPSPSAACLNTGDLQGIQQQMGATLDAATTSMQTGDAQTTAGLLQQESKLLLSFAQVASPADAPAAATARDAASLFAQEAKALDNFEFAKAADLNTRAMKDVAKLALGPDKGVQICPLP